MFCNKMLTEIRRLSSHFILSSYTDSIEEDAIDIDLWLFTLSHIQKEMSVEQLCSVIDYQDNAEDYLRLSYSRSEDKAAYFVINQGHKSKITFAFHLELILMKRIL